MNLSSTGAVCTASKLMCSKGATGPLCGSCEDTYTFDRYGQITNLHCSMNANANKTPLRFSLTNGCVPCGRGDQMTRGRVVLLVIIAILVLGWCYMHSDAMHHLADHGYDGAADRWPMMHLIRQIDIAKLKVVWVGLSIVSTVHVTVDIVFPEPFPFLINVYR